MNKNTFKAQLDRAFADWNKPTRDQRMERLLRSVEANTRYIGETVEMIRQELIEQQARR